MSDAALASRTDAAWRALADVLDPEVPVLSVLDLGIVRDVAQADDGALEVTLTPTYSGCPATEAIEAAVLAALQPLGPVRIQTRWAPAWTTDWISDDGQRKLREYGIAPPGHLVGESTIRFHSVRPEVSKGERPLALSLSKGRARASIPQPDPSIPQGDRPFELRQAQPDPSIPQGERPFELRQAQPDPSIPQGERPFELRQAQPERVVACPRCNSARTERLSAFGATACKALYRCLDCREPFEHFKPI